MNENEPRPVSIEVDTSDPTPPYEQIRRQVISLIASGALGPNDRLPPVRQMANDLGLAAGTVARAYRELEQDGWVTAKRGAGTRVGESLPRSSVRSAALVDLASDFVQRARMLGAEDSDILTLLNKSL